MASKLLDEIRVVLIEGHDGLRSELAEFLSHQGATVIAFPQPLKALEAVEQRPADLILLDLTDDEYGFQLFRAIRALQPESSGNTPGKLKRDRSTVVVVNSDNLGRPTVDLSPSEPPYFSFSRSRGLCRCTYQDGQQRPVPIQNLLTFRLHRR